MAGPRTVGEAVAGKLQSNQAGVPCPGFRILQSVSAAIDRANVGKSKAASILGTPAYQHKNRNNWNTK